jgi:hypothetical protein
MRFDSRIASLSRFSTCWSLVIALVILGAPRANGQLIQGTIDGNVTDASQAAVAGAKVGATNQDTNFTRDTTTNSTGLYTIPTLPPGTYTLTVSAPGFQTYTRRGVVVTSETVTRADVALTVGQLNETVTVEAQAGNLQADRADVRSEITNQTLSNVPVPIGRNYQMLFVTVPGVSPPQNGHSFGANSARTLSFTVNGGNINTNSTRVDGASTTNFSALDSGQYVPALEAIETVSVASNSFDADQTTGGAAVNVNVKSGTNAIHGSLFEDHADQHIQTYAWNADRSKGKPKYINNQFGGTIGGPIKKDKLFYFISYESTRFSQSNPVVAQVPTPAMKAGDLSRSPTAIYDPLTGNPDGSGRMPFQGNIIPTSRIDLGVQALIANGSWSNPNQAGTGAFGLGRDFINSASSGARRDQWDTKLTWNPNSKLSMFVRWGFNDSNWYNPQLFGILGGPGYSPTNTAVGIGEAHVFSGTISATYVFNANLVADAYFGYSRNDMDSKQPAQNQNLGWTLLQIPGLNTSGLTENKQLQQGGFPTLTIDGFAVLGSPNNFQPQSYRDPERNYNININWLKGTHNIRGGFDSDFQDSNEMQYQTPAGSFISNAGGFHFTQGTTQLRGGPGGNDFNAVASFLLGLPQDSGKIFQFPDEYQTRTKYFAVYIRDRWQVTPKLTLSYGVRFDYYPFPRHVGRGLEYYVPTNGTMVICGIASNPVDCGITRDRYHVVPRLGVAYRLTDSTVIRAGYSMATDPILFMSSRRLNYPDIYGQLLLPPNSFSYATTLRQGLPAVTPPNLSSGVVPVPGIAAINTYDNADYVRGYIQTWNVTVEQRVKGWVTSAAYVGTRAIDPQNNIQMNWSPIGGGTAGEILNQLTGRTASTQLLGTLGTNTYDGLQTRAQRRFGSGYQINVSYAFGKALGYATTPAVSIPQYYRLNRGPQAQDINHNFALTGVAELPFGKGKRWAQNGLASKLAGGWQLSTVLSAYSGRPFTPTASSTSLNSPNSSQFADCISAPRQTGNIFQWYDKSAFAVPTAGQFGTCGTGSLRGPALHNVDFGVERKFPVRERFELKFRAEMFNLGNTPHHNIPNSTNSSISNSTFLQATDIVNTGRDGVEQRTMRFSLRLGW